MKRATREQQVAQGDVLLSPAELPKGARRLETRTLAYGEATGHHHTLTAGADLYTDGHTIWVVVGEPGAVLQHQEHEDIALEVGVWVYSPQIEPDPFTGVRRVTD